MSRGVSNNITYKPYSRNEQWLLQPSFDELLPENNFVRIVSKTVNELRIEKVFFEKHESRWSKQIQKYIVFFDEMSWLYSGGLNIFGIVVLYMMTNFYFF